MPTYRISKRFAFSASHQLTGLPEGHQCARLHGHNYEVELELSSDHLDATGFVLDYGEMAIFKAFLDEQFDHRHLNDAVSFNPTAELLAQHLFGIAENILGAGIVSAVRVSETPKTMAEFRPAPTPFVVNPKAEAVVEFNRKIDEAESQDRWAGIRP